MYVVSTKETAIKVKDDNRLLDGEGDVGSSNVNGDDIQHTDTKRTDDDEVDANDNEIKSPGLYSIFVPKCGMDESASDSICLSGD